MSLTVSPSYDLTVLPKDSLCLPCFEDSIDMVMARIKRNMAKTDSISRIILRKAEQITKNNQDIDIVLRNCSHTTENLTPENHTPCPSPQERGVALSPLPETHLPSSSPCGGSPEGDGGCGGSPEGDGGCGEGYGLDTTRTYHIKIEKK